MLNVYYTMNIDSLQRTNLHWNTCLLKLPKFKTIKRSVERSPQKAYLKRDGHYPLYRDTDHIHREQDLKILKENGLSVTIQIPYCISLAPLQKC